jgi:hypothetical protein
MTKTQIPLSASVVATLTYDPSVIGESIYIDFSAAPHLSRAACQALQDGIAEFLAQVPEDEAPQAPTPVDPEPVETPAEEEVEEDDVTEDDVTLAPDDDDDDKPHPMKAKAKAKKKK